MVSKEMGIAGGAKQNPAAPSPQIQGAGYKLRLNGDTSNPKIDWKDVITHPNVHKGDALILTSGFSHRWDPVDGDRTCDKFRVQRCGNQALRGIVENQDPVHMLLCYQHIVDKFPPTGKHSIKEALTSDATA